MRVICAWCGKILSPSLVEGEGTSHGICEKCLKIQMAELAELRQLGKEEK